MKWGSSSASDGTVNIERLLKLQVTLDWQEAVAIVLETAEVLERERRRSMPTQRNIVLTPTGTVEFAKGRTQSGPSVSALAQTLGALLPTDYPTQLRLILSTAGPNVLVQERERVLRGAEVLRAARTPQHDQRGPRPRAQDAGSARTV